MPILSQKYTPRGYPDAEEKETGALPPTHVWVNTEQHSLQASARQTYLNLRQIVRIFDDEKASLYA
jgi:hypothetical protein